MLGRQVLHYTILDKLGEGGMGVVYLARDTRLDRVVALKVLEPSLSRDSARLRRFILEAKAASALNHPNIVTIYDVNESEGLHFIAMEHVDGETIKNRIARTSGIALTESLDLAIQMADALVSAHAMGIIHRDLKPTNLMVTPAGLLKVLDFGLAKLNYMPSTGDSVATRTAVLDDSGTEPGTVLGTPAYMSPEQAEGRLVDTRSDIFSFGSVLYEMITGHSAFGRQSQVATLVAVLRDEPAPLRQFCPQAPVQLEEVVGRCLRKQPDNRPQDIAILKTALQDVLSNLKPSSTSKWRLPALQDLANSIAVLPFTDMTPGRDQQYFCDGISEEIINALSKMPNARVAGRASAFALKNRKETLATIGAQLHVGMVLDGSVRRAGDRLRITAELLSVSDGYQLWSQRFDSEMKDIFEIQDEIALAVAEKLKVRLGGGITDAVITRYTDNLEAYNLYLQGRYCLGQRTKQSHEAAIRYFEQAIAHDPNYALAYAGLADAWVILGIYWLPPSTAFGMAKQAALTAVGMRDTLAEAHASLGVVSALYDWDITTATHQFRRALELNPAYANAHAWYGLHVLGVQGRFEEAVREMSEALRLDPLSPPAYMQFATLLYHRREFAKAIRLLDKFLDMSPVSSMGFKLLSFCHLANGNTEEGLKTLRRAVKALGDTPSGKAFLAYEFALIGNASAALTVADELTQLAQTVYIPEMDLVYLYILLKDLDSAIHWLEKAFQQRSPVMLHLKVAPMFDSLRSESRFQTILSRVGI
jgi:serine/threonine protein kinase/Tfp pilus assembly protein PilF